MLQNISKKPKATCTSTQCTWRRGTPAHWGRIGGSSRRTSGGRGEKLQLGKEGGHTTVEGRHQCQARPVSHTIGKQVNGAGKAPGRLRRSEGFEGPSSSFTKRLQGCCEQYRSDGSTLQARGKKAKMESFEYSFGDRFEVVLRSLED